MITPRQPRARDIQFSGYAGRYRLEPLVEHEHAGIGDRRSDRHDAPGSGRTVSADRGHRGPDRRLGRPVQIDGLSCDRSHHRRQRRREHIAAHEHAQPPDQAGLRGQHRLPQRGSALHDGRAGLAGQLGQRAWIAYFGAPGHDHARARRERQVELEDVNVERHGGDGEHPVRGRHPDPLSHRGEEVHHPLVRDHHALRGPRRPRGVRHVGRILRCQRGLAENLAACRRVDLEHGDSGRQVRRARHHGRRRQHARWRRVAQDERDPLRRVLRIHRQVRRPGLQHRQQPGHQGDRPVEQHRHHPLRSRSPPRQERGQPSRGRVQLGVTQVSVPAADRHRVGGPRRLGREQLGHRDRGHLTRGVVPLGHDLVPLRLGQQLHPVQRDGRVTGDGRQHGDQPPHDQPRGRGAEQVGRRDQHPVQPGGPAVVEDLGDREIQVIPGRRVTGRQHGGVHAGQVQYRRGGVLHRQHHLEQRMPGQRPDRIQHLDQLLERHILLRQGGQPRLPHPPEQLSERGVSGRVGAQNQRVDEEPDLVLQRLIAPAGDR